MRAPRAAALGMLVPLAWTLSACDPIAPMPEDLPCREAGYAIAARTAECTGDAALGQERYESYRKTYSCIEWSPDDPQFWDTAGAVREVGPEDLFSCAHTIRNVPCEMVEELGDDIGAWLNLDPGCSWVAEPKSAGGGQ